MLLRRCFAVIVGACLLFLSGMPAVRAGSEPLKPVLVELFTSEGCSSCPPADAFLRELDSKQPVDGVQLIVLEEHVDYWDDQGWKDPFSSRDVTLRQVSYTQRLRVDGPYTPEMVVAGAYQFVGSHRGEAAAAIQKARQLPAIPVRVSSAKIESGEAEAHVETGPVPVRVDVIAALVLDHVESQVQRGENCGRRLEHVAVVKKLAKLESVASGQSYSKDLRLDANSLSHPSRLVVFLQEPGQGKIIGAAMTVLP